MSERPLRILMVFRAPVGGLYRHVIDLTQALAERGHEVGLVMDSLTSDAQTDQRLSELTYAPSFGVHRIPMPRFLGPGDFTANWKVRQLANRFDVDVLHGHGAKGGFNARLARVGNQKRVALYTPHGGVINYRPSSLTGKFLRWIEARLLAITDGVIFESAFAQSAFESQVTRVPSLRPVVHNGLGAGEFVPLPAEAATYDFSYVGELRGAKGLDYLLEAMVDLKRPDGTPATMILGGGGPETERLMELTQKLNLTDRLNFVGVQPAREVFVQGRCVVLPSLAESLPYVALEAAAANKPLIATDVGGIHEIFGPTKDSLIPAADSMALGKAMQSAIDNPEAAQSEAETRLAFVRDNFSISKMADEIVATYRDALGRR